MKNLFGDETPQIVNVASVPHRSPFRYPGGKTWLVPLVRRCLSSLPWKPAMFGEPFAGGAIVGLTALFEDLAKGLAIVELDESVASVWQAILNGKAKELCERILSFKINKSAVKEELTARPSNLADRAFTTIRTKADSRLIGERQLGTPAGWLPRMVNRALTLKLQPPARVGGDAHYFVFGPFAKAKLENVWTSLGLRRFRAHFHSCGHTHVSNQ